ncbi:MAG: hypothetical protein ACREDT_14955 [Methylocella sp.]
MPESLARAVAAEIARRRRAKIGHEDRGGRATRPAGSGRSPLKSPPLLATSGLTASAAPRIVLP